MTRGFLKLASASAFAFSLVAAPAAAQSGLNEWDVNQNTAIDEDEWTTGFGQTGAFGEWDADDDEMLNEDEFNQGVFNTFDADESGELDEEEFGLFEENQAEFGAD